MREMMIDIETLDVVRTAVVMQVGVAIWQTNSDNNLNVIYQRQFNLDVEQQLRAGRTVCWQTIKFWLEQPDAARLSVASDDNVSGYDDTPPTQRWTPSLFFANLSRVAEEKRTIDRYWAKGTFDFDILEDLAAGCRWEQGVPWNFRSKRDLRTALDFHPEAKFIPRPDDMAHTGLADAIHQINQLEEVRRGIRP